MKKSKSSVPLLEARKLLCELVDVDPNTGLLGAAFVAAEERVAIAVGKTNDGESFPAKPNLVKPVPL
ncbi:hypothetical protein WICMUC_001479 [Wickerhamomyces mucosus]|uniref:Uncharacterized protein n=1 Tax=Wickerhamomyces mucosus TaxID=1378264 RepID=A0A9P8PVP5_9ASCO|nr:hypothetical protein WICMUC_001479 [Wickerhamomyces mucosus]